MRARELVAVLSLAIAGCSSRGASTDASASTAAPSTASPPAPSASASAAKAGASTLDVDIDPEMLALAQRVLRECDDTWKPERGFDPACPAFAKYNNLGFEIGRHDPGFVGMVAQKDPKIRLLGARMLASWGRRYATKRDLAERVVAAAEAETTPALFSFLGFAVGKIDEAATGLGDRIKALAARKETSQAMREALAAALIPHNRGSDLALQITRDLTRPGEPRAVRVLASSALLAAYDRKPDVACAAWRELAGEADEVVAASAAARITGGLAQHVYDANGFNASVPFPITGNKCPADLEAAIDAIDERAKGGRVTDEAWTIALQGVFRRDLGASEGAKKKAVTAARRIVETRSNSTIARMSALRVLGAADPDARAFAKKFEADDVAIVAAAAKEITSGKAR